MKEIAVKIMLLTILSKILGFARDVTLSYFYGASSTSDAYLIAITIPLVIFIFIGTGISTGFIPMYTEIEHKKSVKDADVFTNKLINLLLISCVIITVFGFIFTETIVRIFASGFSGDTLRQAVSFTRVSLFGIFFSALTYLLRGYLQIKDSFMIPSIIGFPLNIIIIASIFISSRAGTGYLIYGSLAAMISQAVLLIPFSYRKGLRYRAVLDLKDRDLRKLALISIPIIIGVSVEQINIIIDRTLASGLAVGGISALNYSNKLTGFIQGVFVLSIVTAMYPPISKMAVVKDIEGLKKMMKASVSIIGFLVIPAAVGAVVFSGPIVRLLFGRGAFDDSAVMMTSGALLFYAPGMLGFGLREVFSRVFYSLQDTKTPVINASAAMGINIVLNFILSRIMGLNGLALATSIAATVCCVLLASALRKKIGKTGLSEVFKSFVKIILASATAVVSAKALHIFLLGRIAEDISTLLSIAACVVIYLVVSFVLKSREMMILKDMIARKLDYL